MPPPNPDRMCASAVRAARTAEPAGRPSGRGRRTASTSGPGDAEASRRLALLASPVAPLVGCGPEGAVTGGDQPQHAGGAQEGSEEEEGSIQQQVVEKAGRQLHPTEAPADEKEVPAGAASGGGVGGGGGMVQHHSESSEAMLGALQQHGDASVASVQQRQRGPSSLDQQVCLASGKVGPR